MERLRASLNAPVGSFPELNDHYSRVYSTYLKAVATMEFLDDGVEPKLRRYITMVALTRPSTVKRSHTLVLHLRAIDQV